MSTYKSKHLIGGSQFLRVRVNDQHGREGTASESEEHRSALAVRNLASSNPQAGGRESATLNWPRVMKPQSPPPSSETTPVIRPQLLILLKQIHQMVTMHSNM